MSYWQAKPVTPDPKLSRPKNRAAAIRQVRAIFDENKWDAKEQSDYLAEKGLPAGDVGALDNDQLRVILDDFEASGMILYADENTKETVNAEV